MNPWPFIVASYAIAAIAVVGLVLHSWLAMRRGEREAAALGRET